MESRRYPTDLSDDEWRCISPHLLEPAGWGRPRLHGLRTILDAVFYVLRSSCPWRLLPRDFPPWKSVYDWFRRWRIDGTWERLNIELRERLRSHGLAGTRILVPGSWTPNPRRPLEWAESKEATTVARSSAAARGTCWWIPKVWCSEPRYTALGCTTRMASSCCWSPRERLERLSHLWVDAGYQGRGRR